MQEQLAIKAKSNIVKRRYKYLDYYYHNRTPHHTASYSTAKVYKKLFQEFNFPTKTWEIQDIPRKLGLNLDNES